MKKTVKRIDIRMVIKGNGIINYDGSNEHKKIDGNYHNNYTYAKRVYPNREKLSDYLIKISHNSLRNSIFGESHNPNIVHHKDIFMIYLANPSTILRGFLYAKEETNKKSTGIMITDAIQTCSAKSIMETMTRSGGKDLDETSEQSDTSYYFKETIGDITYASTGTIDLETLSFVSCDQLYDRFAINPDDYELFTKYFKHHYPNFDSKLSYYRQKGSSVMLPECGFVFKNDILDSMVKLALEKVALYRNVKNNGRAEMYKMEIRPVFDALDDNEEWITIVDKSNDKFSTRDAINALSFDYENYYEEVEDGIAVPIRETMEKGRLALKEKKAEEKRLKKEASDKKKEAVEKKKKEAVENKTETNA